MSSARTLENDNMKAVRIELTTQHYPLPVTQ